MSAKVVNTEKLKTRSFVTRALWHLIPLSWTCNLLYALCLVPMHGLRTWPFVAAALWAALNLFATVHVRSQREREQMLRQSPRRIPSRRENSTSRKSQASAPAVSDEGDQDRQATAKQSPPMSAAVSDNSPPELVEGTSLLKDALRRFQRNRLATLCCGLLLALVLLCVSQRILFAVGTELNWSSDFFRFHIDHTAVDKSNTFGAPDARHWFGTDGLGRDVFARTLYGGSISFLVALVGTVVSIVIGISWGSVAGYHGGKIDHYMMRVVDILYGIPFMFLVILIMSLESGIDQTAGQFRPLIEEHTRLLEHQESDSASAYAAEHGITFGVRAAVFISDHVSPIVIMFFALGLVHWLTMARIVRGQVLSLRNQEFVLAARLTGASTSRIIRRHIVPNLLGPVIVYSTLTIPTLMLAEAFLSFLGLGVSEPHCSWGSLASDGIKAINSIRPYWWVLLYPSVAISLTLFSLNFAGDGLRDALDPRGRR